MSMESNEMTVSAAAEARALGYDCRFRSVYRGYAALAELRAGRA